MGSTNLEIILTEVWQAVSAREALAQASAGRIPEFVVVDLCLPDSDNGDDGCHATLQLRERAAERHITAPWASAQQRVPAELTLLGADRIRHLAAPKADRAAQKAVELLARPGAYGIAGRRAVVDAVADGEVALVQAECECGAFGDGVIADDDRGAA